MRFLAVRFSLLLLVWHALTAAAVPGEFDRSFGQNGIATFPTEAGSAAYFITNDSASRLLVTGKDRSNEFFARLQPNGGLDPDFNGVGFVRGVANGIDSFGDTLLGHTGQWISQLAGGQLLATRVDITSCSVTICRFRSQTIRARRFNPDGSAVNAANADVVVTGGFRPTQVVEQTGSGLVFITSVIYYLDGVTQLARLGENGLVDPSFAANAKVRESCRRLPGDNGFRLSSGTALGLAGGKILLAQHISFLGAGAGNLCISRLNADGMLDQTYGSAGDLILDSTMFTSANNKPVALFATSNGGAALLLQQTFREPVERYQYLIVWLTAQGGVDTARPDQGITVPTDLQIAIVTAATMQPDGKILIAGYPAIAATNANGAQQIDYAQPRLRRLLQQGGHDLTFGPGGLGYTPMITLGKRLIANHLHIGADGSIFIAGELADAGPVATNEARQFAVGKLQSDPASTSPPVSQNNGGGGCGITTGSRIDPILPGLAMLALLSLWLRRRGNHKIGKH